jgi:hypothetical protein
VYTRIVERYAPISLWSLEIEKNASAEALVADIGRTARQLSGCAALAEAFEAAAKGTTTHGLEESGSVPRPLAFTAPAWLYQKLPNESAIRTAAKKASPSAIQADALVKAIGELLGGLGRSPEGTGLLIGLEATQSLESGSGH